MSITVTGGAGSIDARADDLVAMAGLLHAAAASLADARDTLSSPLLIGQLHTERLLSTVMLHDELRMLTGPFGELTLATEHLESLAAKLRAIAALYRNADTSVLDDILGAVGHLALSASLLSFGELGAARDQFYRALPGFTDLAMAHVGPLEIAYSLAVPKGHAVLHDLGPDESPVAHVAPRTLTDLIDGVAVVDRGRAGQIAVSFVTGADGRRRAIVDIPGTKSWNPLPNHNITSVGADIRALTGADTAYEDGILAALSAAGVRPDEEVMLVGHSEGGIVAINAASSAARSGRFRITHVLTAGSPIGKVARELPRDVQVLALENSADVAPHVDSSDNPATANVTTVTVDDEHGTLGANHGLTSTYEPAAAQADHSRHASIRAFTRSARGFLDAPRMRTHGYRITRGF